MPLKADILQDGVCEASLGRTTSAGRPCPHRQALSSLCWSLVPELPPDTSLLRHALAIPLLPCRPVLPGLWKFTVAPGKRERRRVQLIVIMCVVVTPHT